MDQLGPVNIPVIVAAAGGSSRCPEGKLTKSWQGRPLLKWLLDTLRVHPKVGTIRVITGHRAEHVRRVTGPGVQTHHNPGWASGLASTLKLAESLVEPGSGFLVALGDTPLVRPETLDAILSSPTEDKIRVPVYRGLQGHPVYFPDWVRAYWHLLEGDRGAKTLFRLLADRVERVPVEDPGVIRDFNRAVDFEPARIS